MPRTCTTRAVVVRAAAGLAALLLAACSAPPDYPPAPPAMPGVPAGAVVVPASGEFEAAVQRLTDAVTAGGAAETTVVDNAADAVAVGVEVPPNTVVIGGSTEAHVPLLRAAQTAALNLPPRYLVQQGADGAVTITYNGPDFIAAMSGVSNSRLSLPLAETVAAVAEQAAPVAAAPLAAPLVNVRPGEAVTTVFGSADVPITVERLRRGADVAPSEVVAILDLAEGSTPALRPTTLVLVSTPEVEAPLVAATPSFGMELPMRFVVWSDAQGRTQIGYIDVERLATRHGIPAGDPDLARLAADANRLARIAAGINQ